METEVLRPAAELTGWRKALSLDLRSLALFRIALGLILGGDLISRIPLIDAFYTDGGLVPRTAAFHKMHGTWAVSLHLISGEWWVQFLLFAIAIVFAAGMVAGYRTRMCTVLSWLLFSSMHVRDPFDQYFADLALQAFLFWGMFLPLNGRWSLDAALNRTHQRLDATVFSWATQAYVLQVCFIYWFTAIMKWDPSWTRDGTAVYYALSLDFSIRPFGKYLLGFPTLLPILTRATLVLELFGPFLLLSPFLTAPLRLLAVVLFVGFHAGLATAMDLSGFSAVMIVGWLALMPGVAWEAPEKWIALLVGRAAPLRVGFNAWADSARRNSERMRRVLSPPAPSVRLGFVGRGLVLCGVTTVFATSVANVPAAGVSIPKPWVDFAVSSQLSQQWAMYAGPPFLTDGWYVIDGVLMDGRHADVWRGGEVTTAKPADVPGSYRNSKWRAYLLRLYAARYYDYRGYFGRYLCRTWNARHTGQDRVNLIYISFMLEKTVPPGQLQPPAVKDPVLRHYCFDKPADW